MKKVESKIVALANCFESDYHRKMIVSNMIRNCDFLIEANNKQHTAKVAEINSVFENYDEARDANRAARIGEYIDTLTHQHKDLMSYKADLLIAYKNVVGEDYEAPAQTSTTNAAKAAAKYRKQFAQA